MIGVAPEATSFAYYAEAERLLKRSALADTIEPHHEVQATQLEMLRNIWNSRVTQVNAVDRSSPDRSSGTPIN